MKDRVAFSLDIGSSKIVSVSGVIGDGIKICGVANNFFVNNYKNNEFLIVNHGVICDLNSIIPKVNKVLNDVKRSADCSYGSVILNIASNQTKSICFQKNINLEDCKITKEVMHNLNLEINKINIPKSYEILDYEIQEYLLDNQFYTINPINMAATNIQSNVNMFISGTTQINNLKTSLKKSQFSLSKIVPSGVLSGMAVLNAEEKDLGCCLLDIGAGTTDIVVYQNGYIRYLYSIPLGGEDITTDIANVFKISRNLAEDIKLNYGAVNHSTIKNNLRTSGFIEINDQRGVKFNIQRKLLLDVISARIEEILKLVKTILDNNKVYDIIKSGFIITGGTSLISGMAGFAENLYNVPVRIGVPNYEGDYQDVILDPRYASVVGGLYFIKEYMSGDIKNTKGNSSGWPWSLIKKIFSAES